MSTGPGVVLLVTRPGEPGRRLAAGLDARGQAALWWPAFDLLPSGDPRAVQDCLARLAQFDLVVFVSPMAVRALAAARGEAPWPGAVRIAAVGGASLRAARLELALAPDAVVLGPAGPAAGDGGAEALWPLLSSLQPAARHVLIVRAQSGRTWLAEHLRDSGAQVEELEAYRRVAHEPQAADWTALRSAVAGGAGAQRPQLAVLFSSTEAVDVLTRSLQREQLGPELPGAMALCVHERIAQAAHAAGWQDVRACEPEPAAVLLALLGAPGAQASPPPCGRPDGAR